MAIAGDGNLHVYVLNVGQADTSVIVLPSGKVIVIDAVHPGKLVRLLSSLGLARGDSIAHLVITHPHYDHCNGANRLAEEYRIETATLSPFWNRCGMGSPTYQKFVARLQANGVHCSFLSGYGRWYPDGAMDITPPAAPVTDASLPFLELLGPTNNLMVMLERSKCLDTNHLTVMSRLNWGRFRMVFAGDAQMENWASFDSEDMLKDGCTALKAAHHGSGNGTQWERINRLGPRYVFVPADPHAEHRLPDVVGTAVFARYSLKRDGASPPSNVVTITADSGSVCLTVGPTGLHHAERFCDSRSQQVDHARAEPLDWMTNPTDWQELLCTKATEV